MVVPGEAVGGGLFPLLAAMLVVTPMFIQALLGMAAPAIGSFVSGLFKKGGSGGGFDLGSLLGMLAGGGASLLGAGKAPTSADILKDNPELAQWLASLGVLSSDVDKEYEGLKGRTNELEALRTANLLQTGIQPRGMADVPGLEFLGPILEQFSGVDSSVIPKAMSAKDMERLVQQQLALKQAISGMGIQGYGGVMSGQLGAAKDWANAAGGSMGSISQMLGQDNFLEQLRKMISGQDFPVMNFLQQLFQSNMAQSAGSNPSGGME